MPIIGFPAASNFLNMRSVASAGSGRRRTLIINTSASSMRCRLGMSLRVVLLPCKIVVRKSFPQLMFDEREAMFHWFRYSSSAITTARVRAGIVLETKFVTTDDHRRGDGGANELLDVLDDQVRPGESERRKARHRDCTSCRSCRARGRRSYRSEPSGVIRRDARERTCWCVRRRA